jgi:uncharacterized protein YcbK (DUF882 family)
MGLETGSIPPGLRKGLVALGVVASLSAGAIVLFARVLPASASKREPAPKAELVNVPTVHHRSSAGAVVPGDSLFGRSGALRVRLLLSDELAAYPVLIDRFGERATAPGVRTLNAFASDAEFSFSFVTMLPWREKLGRYIKNYHVGYWPGERGRMAWNYENPEGFIEVTPENQYTQLSEHFTLYNFVTHDQRDVWPKYVVLREELLDKLELVLQAVEATGAKAGHVEVLSGFRHPHYNSLGAVEGNMARHSRHQFGDAADLIVDDDRNGRMDDLNRDGRVDINDVNVIQRAVEKVELRYPELVGGVGVYHSMGPRGPFAHIDVRGERARWTNAPNKGTTKRWRPVWSAPAATQTATSIGRCAAEGAMAALCAGIR